MLKKCSICKINKPTSDFHKWRTTKAGIHPACKLCRKLHNPTIRQRQKMVVKGILLASKPNHKICSKCCIEKPMTDFKGNRKTCIACNTKTCRKCGKIKHLLDFNPQKRTCKACKNLIDTTRRQKDIVYKLRRNVSHYIARALASNGSHKTMSFLKAVPYTMEELKEHITKQFEPWMNWDNYGSYRSKLWNDNDPSTWKWSLDHIIPQKKLPYYSMEEENFQKCWALSNLRPLSAKQNMVKGDRYF